MTTSIFVNLPVSNIPETKAFFAALGFSFDPRFSDDKAICMQINEYAYYMLLKCDYFQTFTNMPLPDVSQTAGVLHCISRASRTEVDQFVDQAISLGGTETRDPQDHGFMFNRSFRDINGHIWEVMWMDLAAFTELQSEALTSQEN